MGGVNRGVVTLTVTLFMFGMGRTNSEGAVKPPERGEGATGSTV